ncbi:PIG-L deacetylase family protein [Lysobacter sp. TAF61]|uniref:PIG-L deacetylase family protein n=1 Tax=Lysobacter sp. TAF61 TaxID=3233072 RepID=UPI003F98C90D
MPMPSCWVNSTLMRSDSLPLLAILAHPDDEFAIFAYLERATANGREVHVAWLTDGGWGGQSIERRRLESVEVLRILGIPQDRLHFVGEELGIADGSLHERLDQVVPHLRNKLAPTAAGEVLVPAWEGGHHDHDAAHLAALALVAGRECEVRQFSLYHGAGLPGPLFRVLSPLSVNGQARVVPTTLAMRARYVGLCLRFRSQRKSFLGLLPFYALKMLRSDAFVTQPVARERTVQRPHPGPMLYERRGGPSWEAFARATERYRWSD